MLTCLYIGLIHVLLKANFFGENEYDGNIFGMWKYECDKYVKFAQLWLING